MNFNWKYFFAGGIVASTIFGTIDYFSNNMFGAKFQLVVGLAYAASLAYLSLRKKK